MPAALRARTVRSVAEIIEDLENADLRPDAVLQEAVGHAQELAPTVIDLVEQAATGADLLEHEENLLFWGIHVLGAARRTELFQPLMRLLRQIPTDRLEQLLGDVLSESLASIVISVFDGKSAPLVDACADRDVGGYARWSLIGALARLTFDGAVARETTLAFLDRFDRETLAEPGDLAWQGWQDAICLLGLEDMWQRLLIACREGRFVLRQDNDLEFCEEQLRLARELAPGCDDLFCDANYVAIDDPVEALEWVDDEDDEEDDSHACDPASSFALTQEEIDWFTAFLKSERLPPHAITVEQIDGYLCALAMDPDRARARKCIDKIFGATGETSVFENVHQRHKVQGLITRMWNTIHDRLNGHYAHWPLLQTTNAPQGQLWAKGFHAGTAITESEWHQRIDSHEDILLFLSPILRLVLNDGEQLEDVRMTPEYRQECVALLRPSILGVYTTLQLHALRARPIQQAQPARSTKVGRNDPCPCGSTKKYKRCCGSSEKLALH